MLGKGKIYFFIFKASFKYFEHDSSYSIAQNLKAAYSSKSPSSKD